MVSSWQNEAGEPIMDAASWRAEQYADEQSAYERDLDPDLFQDDYPYDEDDEDGLCRECDEPLTDEQIEAGREYCTPCLMEFQLEEDIVAEEEHALKHVDPADL